MCRIFNFYGVFCEFLQQNKNINNCISMFFNIIDTIYYIKYLVGKYFTVIFFQYLIVAFYLNYKSNCN